MRLFLEKTQDDSLASLWRVLLSSQCRIGELLALRWENVDTQVGGIVVNETLTRTEVGKWKIGPVKGRKGHRVALDCETMQCLAAERARWVAKWGRQPTERDFVWPAPSGSFRSEGGVRGHFYRLQDRVGVPRLKLHGVRHTGATILLRRNVHPKVVSERLGHSKVSMTLDRYSHVLPDMQGEAASAIGDALSPSAAAHET